MLHVVSIALPDSVEYVIDRACQQLWQQHPVADAQHDGAVWREEKERVKLREDG